MNNDVMATTKQQAEAEETINVALDTLAANYDNIPLGVIKAFNGIKAFLTDVVTELGADTSNPVVEKAVGIRELIGDAEDWFNFAEVADPNVVNQQTAAIASKVLEAIENYGDTHMRETNPFIYANLDWIIPALENDENSKGALSEAYKFKLTLEGAPDAVNEIRFLSSQELLISRLLGSVPVSAMYSYWMALTPVTELGQAYHDAVQSELTKLPPENWPLSLYASANAAFWEAIAQTVEANSRDSIMRILSQQSTAFLKGRIGALKEHLAHSKEPWAQSALERAAKVLSSMKLQPVFPHAFIGVFDLSPEAANFAKTAEMAHSAACY